MVSGRLKVRSAITRLQEALILLPDSLTAEDFDTAHYFAPGLYGRRLVLEPDSVIVGKIHKADHTFMLLQGECWLASTAGLQHIEAPYTCKSKQGIQRAIFAETKCILLTIHTTNTTDLKQLERELIAPTHNVLEEL